MVGYMHIDSCINQRHETNAVSCQVVVSSLSLGGTRFRDNVCPIQNSENTSTWINHTLNAMIGLELATKSKLVCLSRDAN